MAACPKCGVAVAEGAAFCGSCGAPIAQAAGGTSSAAEAPQAGGLTPNVAGMLAYITIIPAILFLVMEPYNKTKYIRFHAFQSLFFQIAWFIVWIAAMFIGAALAMVPVVGLIIDALLWLVVGLGGFVLWVFLLVKAYNNVMFELPVIGKMAADQAGK
jgi:uncharacterized membrane protein